MTYVDVYKSVCYVCYWQRSCVDHPCQCQYEIYNQTNQTNNPNEETNNAFVKVRYQKAQTVHPKSRHSNSPTNHSHTRCYKYGDRYTKCNCNATIELCVPLWLHLQDKTHKWIEWRVCIWNYIMHTMAIECATRIHFEISFGKWVWQTKTWTEIIKSLFAYWGSNSSIVNQCSTFKIGFLWHRGLQQC